MSRLNLLLLLLAMANLTASVGHTQETSLLIFHFDVNAGEATLIISPDRHGVLIDAGQQGRGYDPIGSFLDRARYDGLLVSLDYTIITHYDDDHLGGMDEVYRHGWYPEIAAYDRGNSYLPPFNTRPARGCAGVEVAEAEAIAPWGGAPERWCPPEAESTSCAMLQYILAAERGGKRRELQAGDVLELDHGLQIVTLVANARNVNGDVANVFFEGRRLDCGQDDLSIGLLVKYGDFRYLIAGDLTGDPDARVADVEELIKKEARDVDVYHVNSAGDWTGSSADFMRAIRPSVAIVSNGAEGHHPVGQVVRDRILAVTPRPEVYLANLNPQERAWKGNSDTIADDDLEGFDGMIVINVWENSYRVTRWRNSDRLDKPGRQYQIKKVLPAVGQGPKND